MISLDFSIPNLKNYEKYLIRYQGLDLSFLSINSGKYLNKWAMANQSRTVEDRELVLVYAVPNRDTAKRLANAAMLGSDNNLIQSTVHPGWGALCNCESVSWDDFSNKIEVTVRYIIESGFIHPETYYNKQVLLNANQEGNGTALDWELLCNPSTSIKDTISIFWEIIDWDNNVVARFEMYIPANNGAAVRFSTLHPEKSLIGNTPLVDAIRNGYVLFSGPLIPDMMDNNHAVRVEFNVQSNIECAVIWKIWKRYLIL